MWLKSAAGSRRLVCTTHTRCALFTLGRNTVLLFRHGSLRSSGLVLSQQMLATQAAAAASQAHWSAVAQYHAQSAAMLLSCRSQPGLLKTKSTTPLAASTIHEAVVGGCMTSAPTQLRCFSTQPGERKRRTGSVCLADCVVLLACHEQRSYDCGKRGWLVCCNFAVSDCRHSQVPVPKQA